ncbi:DUF1244 domain-containing protein [Thermaurantiacus sp.]
MAATLADEAIRDRIEAAAFRRLLDHLRLREDVQNIDLMGLAGFCRNCLADWLHEAATEAGVALSVEAAREHVLGEPYAAFKARQPQATREQIERMEASLAENARRRAVRAGTAGA